MSGGVGQDGQLIYALADKINSPGTNENMRLFIDKLDNLPKLKKNNGTVILFPTTGDTPPGLDNANIIYVNGGAIANGDGGIFTPFKTIQDANAFMRLTANDINTKSYLVSIYPGEYDGNDINLPINSSVSLIGMGGAGSTILNFSIYITPSATANANYTVENIFIGGAVGLAINGSGLGANPGNFLAKNCAFNINTAAVGANLDIFLFQCGILGGLINGIVKGIDVSILGDINVNVASKFYTTGLNLGVLTAKVNVVGSGEFYTASMVNPGVSFVVGIFQAATPVYVSDKYSYVTPTGTISIKILDSYTPVLKTSVTLDFITNNVYGTILAPITGDPLVNVSATGIQPVGAKAFMIHNSGVPPVFDISKFKATTLSVPYAVNQLNYIEFTFISDTVTLYTIYQQV